MPVSEGAEAFLELLNANGVRYIFLNPGSDTFPIQEAVSKYKALGKRTPEVVLCLHEAVAMAAAHGYFMVSGKPQMVLVHADQGIQQVGGALHNAQRGRIGVILCSGQVSFEGDKRGSRSHYIHWFQDQFDQAGVVRNYVKGEYELRSTENIHHVMQRAFQIAATEPCGPVYINFHREVLMEEMKEVRIPAVARHSAALTPQIDTEALVNVAEMLIQAEKPLIITGYSGRNTKSVASLVALAETLSARVVSAQSRMNFPTTHPLYGGTEPNPYLKDADVILVIDHDVPYVPSQTRPGPGARIIQIDIDPIKQNIPMWLFPVDVLAAADSSKAIPALTKIIRQRVTTEQQSRFQARFQARFQQFCSEHEKLQAEWRNLAIAKADQRPISPEWLCHCIAEAVDEDTIILDETITNSTSLKRQVPRTKPGTFFTSGGSSLGWALGAALGAKLASPDKTIVSVIGDGSFIFGNPIATLWAASVYRAPFLSIIFNNELYKAPKRHLQMSYGRESFSAKTGYWIGTDIKPSPDYAAISQASHAYGQLVKDPSELKTALKHALDQVHSGMPAVLDVRISEE